MKKQLLLILILFIPMMIMATDYQYQYFDKEIDEDKHLPFSDYIPRVRLHWKTVPHYVEDFYLLYGMKLYYNQNTLARNIAFLETALTKKFRHPSQALVKVSTPEEYLKYRRIIFMHINILIMRNYMKIATRYDMRNIYFHNEPWKKEILESFDIAEKYYKQAKPYWKKAQRYASDASKIKITTDLGTIESERYRIITGDLNYGKIIDTYLKRLDKKRKILRRM